MAKTVISLLVLIALNLSSATETNTENRQGRQSYPRSRPESRQFYFSNPWYRYSHQPYLYDDSYYPAPSPQSHYEFVDDSQARIPGQGARTPNEPIDDLLNWREESVNNRQFNISGLRVPSFLTKPILPKMASMSPPVDSCTDSNGNTGNCISTFSCLTNQGTSSGSCGIGRSCCTFLDNKCGGSITQNNTYWQSPVLLNNEDSCTKTISLEANKPNQFPRRTPICQIRVDFLGFKLAQPGTDGQCSVDFFLVGGTSNDVPVLCGENLETHIYLHVDPSTTDVQMVFSLGTMNRLRSWNLKIAMLPCDAKYLAPSGCLQYFTKVNGNFESFNWKELATSTTTHQLANQDYKICFRSEIVKPNGQIANKICFTPCVTTVTNARSFSLSGLGATALDPRSSAVGAASCPTDYLLIPDGALDSTTVTKADRYCGQQFNPTAAQAAAATVCTTVAPFQILYRTDATEVAGAESGNWGFCFTYEQRAV